MYLLLSLVALVWAAAHVNPYVLIGVVLVYALSYFDGKEYTGERRWDAFRRFPVWRWSLVTPVEYVGEQAHKLSLPPAGSAAPKRVYAMLPGETYMPLVWGIGLHGGRLGAWAEYLHYVLPPVFFWVPVVRDVLLWSGAITWRSGSKTPMESIVMEMLSRNRHVCYCPSSFYLDAPEGIEDVVVVDDSTIPIAVHGLSDAMLGVARSERIQLAAVFVQGERERYYIASPATARSTPRRWLGRVQRWCFSRFSYPFPLCFWRRWCSRTRPPKLTIKFGPIEECTETYATNDALAKQFEANIMSLACSDLGDNTLKLF
jgi:hypothetical protein